MFVHPGALADLNDAAAFYTERANNELGISLISEFERALGMLSGNPELGAVWRGSLRRFPLRRFPYSLVYQVKLQELRVIALAHQRRRPGYWKDRR
ncbi:MAG: type II toxin-antitoxin system RelE/ParE family toxin [Sulfuricella sp.]|nr:type II toxin-antitoxin system RelE/ParE family toxin [Sulfuricella sp.]